MEGIATRLKCAASHFSAFFLLDSIPNNVFVTLVRHYVEVQYQSESEVVRKT
jgi:hypothetical protein